MWITSEVCCYRFEFSSYVDGYIRGVNVILLKESASSSTMKLTFEGIAIEHQEEFFILLYAKNLFHIPLNVSNFMGHLRIAHISLYSSAVECCCTIKTEISKSIDVVSCSCLDS